MHELSIALSLVEQIEQVVREQNALAVRRIRLTVGRLSGVDPEALRAAFPLAAAETIVADGALEVAEVAARVHCRICGRRSEPEAPFLYCGECGALEVDVEAGRELLIQSIEVDVASGTAETGEDPRKTNSIGQPG